MPDSEALAPSGPLDGVRVVDLADHSGAFAGKLLAELGAEVVLIEPPGGHAIRAVPPFWQGRPDRERSVFFWFYAVGKRSLVLDLEHSDGDRGTLGRLCAAADVVVDTGFPGRADELRRAHPHLVVVSITPFGRQGPYRGWRTSDTVAQAVGGMLAVNGHADGPPLRSLGLQAYHQAGVLGAIGAVAALMSREDRGSGQLVDVSQQAAVTGSLEHVPGYFHQLGTIARRQGTMHWTRYFRVGRCRDGWVMHSTLGDWTTLFEWVRSDGMAGALADPSFEETPARQENAERIFDALDAWAERYTVAELHEGAQLRRLPYAAVRAPEALLTDAQLGARGFFVPLDHPGLGREVVFPGSALRFGDREPAHPPRLDEHGEEVRARWLG